MKRKVAQIGPSTLMVSLPNKWVKENNVEKGDELEVVEGEKEITFQKDGHVAKEREVTVDISEFNRVILLRYFEMLYISGYTKINLTYRTQEIFMDKKREKHNITENIKATIKEAVNRYIGMEIVAQTPNMTEIRVFLVHQDEKLGKIERRVYYMFKESVGEFLQELDHYTERTFQNSYDSHDNITKFITYYLRSLNTSGRPIEERNMSFVIYWVIDKILDKFRHVNDMISKYGTTKRVRKLLKDIYKIFFEFFDALFTGKFDQTLITKRYNLVKRIEKEYSTDELRVIAEAKVILDSMNDFARMVIVKGLVDR